MRSEQLIELSDTAGAIAYLYENLRPGDKILVKGSRGIHLEKLADALRAAVDTNQNETKGS